MSGLIDRENNVPPARKLDREAILRFARIDVSVDCKDTGRGRRRGCIDRNIQKCAHYRAVRAEEPHVCDRCAPRRPDGLRKNGTG